MSYIVTPHGSLHTQLTLIAFIVSKASTNFWASTNSDDYRAHSDPLFSKLGILDIFLNQHVSNS